MKTQGAGREGFSRGSKEVSYLGEYKGEITEERPVLLELDLISRQDRLHASRQNQKVPISQCRGLERARKNYPVGTRAVQIRYGLPSGNRFGT